LTASDAFVVFIGKLGAASSPTAGDSMLSGALLFEDLQDLANNINVETGLIYILRGTSRHVTVLFGDTGYVYISGRVNLDNIGKKLCD
jgi:hypothetical protein